MRLTELNISHYKSVESVDLQDISPITVLVGCNGAGKSNVVDALRFLRDAVSQGLDHAVSAAGRHWSDSAIFTEQTLSSYARVPLS
jgi:predicted ATPase